MRVELVDAAQGKPTRNLIASVPADEVTSQVIEFEFLQLLMDRKPAAVERLFTPSIIEDLMLN